MISDYAEWDAPTSLSSGRGDGDRSPDHLSATCHQICNRVTVRFASLRFACPFLCLPNRKVRRSALFVFCQAFVRAHASRIAISADHRSRCVRINHLSSTISREYDDSCTTSTRSCEIFDAHNRNPSPNEQCVVLILT